MDEDRDKYVKDVGEAVLTLRAFDLQHRHTFKVMELLWRPERNPRGQTSDKPASPQGDWFVQPGVFTHGFFPG